MDSNPHIGPELNALAALVHLGRRAREAESPEVLRYIAVNETFAMAPYRQAAIWIAGEGVVALSGVVTPQANAPYVQFLDRLFRQLPVGEGPNASGNLVAGDTSHSGLDDWADWLPAHAVWISFGASGASAPHGAMLFARDTAWIDAERALLEEWAAQWHFAYCAGSRRRGFCRADSRKGGQSGPAREPFSWLKRHWRSKKMVASVILLATLLFPVRFSVLAPGEVVPSEPTVVSAPLDGVVERMLVQPDQMVEAGAPLFTLDRLNVRNRLEIARSALATLEAEYRQKAQLALIDAQSKVTLVPLQAQLAERSAEVRYLEDLYERSTVTATRAGMVIFDNPFDWEGRPVVTGERVMVIADVAKVEIEAWLSPGDRIPVDVDAPVTLYLNSDPLNPVAGRLKYVASMPVARADGAYAYRLRATPLAESGARIGLKGTAKLEGERTIFLYWVLRRPLAALRAWLGV